VFKKGHTMTNTPHTTSVHEESAYQLLIQSEEKERGLIEAIVYLLLVIATTTTIWQFSHEPVTFADLGSSTRESVTFVL
jgi:hypothetical protein